MSRALDELTSILILLAGTVSAMLDRRLANTAHGAFAAVLLTVLVSSLAGRAILSTPVLFRVAGFVLGPETTGVLDLEPGSRWCRCRPSS